MREDLARESAERRAKVKEDAADLFSFLDGLDWDLPDDVRALADNAEKMIKAHPIAALASAFLAGAIVGRLSGRKS